MEISTKMEDEIVETYVENMALPNLAIRSRLGSSLVWNGLKLHNVKQGLCESKKMNSPS